MQRSCRAASLVAAAALLAACHADAPSPARTTRDSVAAPPAAVASVAPAASASDDAWLAHADSALRRHLDRQLFLAAGGYEPDFADCAGDEGSENPTLQAAAVALRPVGHSRVVVDSVEEYPRIVRHTTFDVEGRSVAIFVPQWIAKFTTDSVVPNEELYAGVIAPRVDTFSVMLEENIGMRVRDPELPPAPTGPHWYVCDPGGPAVSEGDGPGFWGFAHADSKWMAIRKWTPADGSWQRVVALADSAKRASNPP